MTTWFVTRHTGAIEWAALQGLQVEQCIDHLEPERVRPGDTVIGVLPINLAAQVCARGANFLNLSLDLPPQARGRELSATELQAYGARLEPYHIERLEPKTSGATTTTPVAQPTPADPPTEPLSADATQPQAQVNTVTTEAPPAIDRSQQPAPPPARPATKRPTSIRQLPEKELIFESFKLAAWGADETENARQLEQLLEEAQRRAQSEPTKHASLPSAMQKARRSGEHAHRLGKELLSKLDKSGPSAEIDAWIGKVSANVDPKVQRHLKIQHKKWIDRQQTLRERADERERNRMQSRAAGKPLSLTRLEPVQLIDGHHPNNLRHQAPASQWEVLIDETGEAFGPEADSLNATDRKLGRVVALAVPEHAKLPALPAEFHAADAKDSVVDRALQAVLKAPVGIFGFTVRDTLATSTQWIGHVHQLVRWVLLQLPLCSEQPCRVSVKIEQRRDWNERESLRAMSSIVEDELRQLHPARYGQLTLSLDFIAKADHPANGYVDAIAFTWGSPSAASKERLKRSRLLGHCLLRPSDDAMIERLYMALDNRRPLPALDWYALCAATASEAPGALLPSFADQLGEQARNTPMLWQTYLNEVRQRLQLKQFRLDELGAALGWLERWCPPGSALSAAQKLRLKTARLASENHRGEINAERFARCLELSDRLVDEAPDEACEAILRLAVTTANNFRFDLLQDTLRDWLARPVAVPGLLNHAKLHSTLGQLLAFCARPTDAVACFDAALAAFGRLSDPEQVRRESAQTTIYRLIARLDDPTVSADERIAGVVGHLRHRTGKTDPSAISRSLACSGQFDRFDHHLWLRTLVAHPQLLAEARAAYLSACGQWQLGEDHPWPLIDAYRAWLLHDAGRDDEAVKYIDMAIASCEADHHGPTLQWMAEVLRVLAQAWGLPLGDDDPAPRLAQLQQSLPYAPFAALATFRQDTAAVPTPAQITAGLDACLPFNFH